MQDLTSRPMLAIVGHILNSDDPEMRTLELAQRRFSREANRRDVEEESVIAALVWLAGCRLQMHNVKGTMHTLGHLRLEAVASIPFTKPSPDFWKCVCNWLKKSTARLEPVLREWIYPPATRGFWLARKP